MPDATLPPLPNSGSPAFSALTERDILVGLMEGVDIDRLLSFLPPRPAWMAQAACRGMSPKTFVPRVQSHPPASRFARSVCRTCPVREQCGDYALEHPELEGIWAGTDASERREHRKGLAS